MDKYSKEGKLLTSCFFIASLRFAFSSVDWTHVVYYNYPPREMNTMQLLHIHAIKKRVEVADNK